MPGALARQSRCDPLLQKWLESHPAHDANSKGRFNQEAESGNIAAHLYSSCRNTLRDLYVQGHTESQERLTHAALKEELAKLYLWGEDFGDGELDLALDYSNDTRCVVLDALAKMGRLLLQGETSVQRSSELSLNTPQTSSKKGLIASSRSLTSFLEPSSSIQQTQDLEHLVELSRLITSSDPDNNEDCNSCGSSDSGEESDDEGNGDLVHVLRFQIRRLVELGPTLQQNLMYAQKPQLENQYPPIVPFHLSTPARWYTSLIREKYKDAEDQLIDRLGEANWQRHKGVRESMEKSSNHKDNDEESPEGLNIETKTIAESFSAFRPDSAFHDSGIGTSVPAQTAYAPSHTSFQSSCSERDPKAVRVPPMPKEAITGSTFRCPFCAGTPVHVRNRVEWKMHVFADLRPYICTFAGCNKELAQFSTRATWADHEFTEHRIVESWKCPECVENYETELAWKQHLRRDHKRSFTTSAYQIAQQSAYTARERRPEREKCPLCLFVPGKSRREFVKHVGRHMEEIALAALPRDVSEDTEEAHSSQLTSSLSSDVNKNLTRSIDKFDEIIDREIGRISSPSSSLEGQGSDSHARPLPSFNSSELPESQAPIYNVPGPHQCLLTLYDETSYYSGLNPKQQTLLSTNSPDSHPVTPPEICLQYSPDPAICPLCDKVASRAKKLGDRIANLNRHMRDKHERGGKAKSCPVPGCGKLFTRTDNLGFHVREEHGSTAMAGGDQPGVTVATQADTKTRQDSSLTEHDHQQSAHDLRHPLEESRTPPSPDLLDEWRNQGVEDNIYDTLWHAVAEPRTQGQRLWYSASMADNELD
ncbi:hypothetical protein ACLMJK_000042 [Lecanora helva]